MSHAVQAYAALGHATSVLNLSAKVEQLLTGSEGHCLDDEAAREMAKWAELLKDLQP